MKKLIVFYSFEGSTRLIAETIAREIGADLLELKPKKEKVKTHGLAKYFWGGRQVFFKEKPELENFDKNPNDYDLIFIGSPVWAWNCAPAMRSFLDSQNLNNKKIVLFCAYEGNKGKIFKTMESKLSKNEIIGETAFLNVAAGKEKNIALAKEWAKKINY